MKFSLITCEAGIIKVLRYFLILNVNISDLFIFCIVATHGRYLFFSYIAFCYSSLTMLPVIYVPMTFFSRLDLQNMLTTFDRETLRHPQYKDLTHTEPLKLLPT